MAKRDAGKETRQRLLNAACEIFARKGYRDARIAEICDQAGANVAAVSYYFEDKAGLYKEVWQYALQNIESPEPAESSMDGPQQLLREYIKNLVSLFAATDRLGQFSRIYLREVVTPTGLIRKSWHEFIEPQRQRLHAILRQLLGPGADDLRIRLCEQSIVNQCRILVTLKKSDLEYLLGHPLDAALIHTLAEHIADFSLAGVLARKVGSV